MLRAAFFALLAFSFSAFAAKTPDTPAASEALFAAPTELRVMLDSTRTAHLTWKNNATASFDSFIEATIDGGEVVTVDAVSQDATSYDHPALQPTTKFVYRIHPAFGPLSDVASVKTGPAPSDEIAAREEKPALPPKGAAPLDGEQSGNKSIKSTPPAPEAGPSNLTATLVAPTSALLQWKDHSSDEEGFLIEISNDPHGPYQVTATVEPNITSFKHDLLPPEITVYFRVRAYFYGAPSNPASMITPPESTPAPAPAARPAP